MRVLTVKDIIIANEKDRLIYNYIIKLRGEVWIQKILNTHFSGATRPYISNIVKYAKLEIPADILNPPKIVCKREALSYLEQMKANLK